MNINFPQGPITDLATGLVTLEWQQWLQNPQFVSISFSSPVGVLSGGTGLSSGTSGGVLSFTGVNTITSSGLLGANQIVLGGGAGVAPSTPLGLGTTTNVLHGNAAGAPTWGAVSLTADVSGILPVANGGTGFTAGPSQTTVSLGADVALTNTGDYFDGPSLSQGSTGTWFASGTVTLQDTAGAAIFYAELTDGTSIVASAVGASSAINGRITISLSGSFISPAGNIRISVRDTTSTSGLIVFNASGLSKDSTISAFRIAA